MCLITCTPLHENHIYTDLFPTLWSSFTELSEVLSAGLEFSFCPSCWFVFSSQQFQDQILPQMISDHPNKFLQQETCWVSSARVPLPLRPSRGISHPLIPSLCLFAVYPYLSLHLESSPVLHWSVFPPTQYFLDETWFCHINYYLFWFSLTPRLVPLSWVSLASLMPWSTLSGHMILHKKKGLSGWLPAPAPWFLTLCFLDCTQGKDQDRIVSYLRLTSVCGSLFSFQIWAHIY